MTTKSNLEKVFGTIEKSKWITAAEDWKHNLHWMEYAQDIALQVLEYLDEKSISREQFAEQMNIAPEILNRWLTGKENFTLETIGRLETILGFKLIKMALDE